MEMVQKPVYVAADGKEFIDKAECERYEELLSKTTYWRVTHSPDLTEGRGYYGLSFFTFTYGGYLAPSDYMIDFCIKRFGPKVEFVQGVSAIPNWTFEQVQLADFERNDHTSSVGDTRRPAKKYQLVFGSDQRLMVAEEIK